MKDLYRRLNMDGPVADLNQLGRAIDHCADSETARAARHILLNPARKRVYDRTHRVLTTVGQLRARLDLPETDPRQSALLSDFTVDQSGGRIDLLDAMDESDPFAGMNVDPFSSANDPAVGEPVAQNAHGVDTSVFQSDTQSNPELPVRIAIGIVGVLGVCLLLVVAVLLWKPDEPFPRNGTVKHNTLMSTSKTGTIQLVAPRNEDSPEHIAVEISDSDSNRPVLTVFVRDGMEVEVPIAPGDYVLKFSVGKEKDWDGKRFRNESYDIDAADVPVSGGTTTRFEIQ